MGHLTAMQGGHFLPNFDILIDFIKERQTVRYRGRGRALGGLIPRKNDEETEKEISG